MEPKAPTATVGQRDYFCGYPTPQTDNFNARMQVRIGIYANEPQLSTDRSPVPSSIHFNVTAVDAVPVPTESNPKVITITCP